MGCYPHARFYFNQPDAASFVIFTRVASTSCATAAKCMMIAMFSAGIHEFSIHRHNKSGYAPARKYSAFFQGPTLVVKLAESFPLRFS